MNIRDDWEAGFDKGTRMTPNQKRHHRQRVARKNAAKPPRGLMFTVPEIVRELSKGRDSAVDLTVRAVPSQRRGKGPVRPPFGEPGTHGIISEPVKLCGVDFQSASERGASSAAKLYDSAGLEPAEQDAGRMPTPRYTVEYLDGSIRTLNGTPGQSLQRKGWVFARYTPSVCLRIEYNIVKNECRPLSTLTEAEVKRATPWLDLKGYIELWDKLNAERGYPSSMNPLCWFIWFAVTKVAK